MRYLSRTVGRCLTEYKREDYDSVVKLFSSFLLLSQFHNPETDRARGTVLSEPRCGAGDVLYGIAEDGSLTELMSIIDSSD